MKDARDKAFEWPREEHRREYAWKWRFFQITDAKRRRQHVLAVGVDETGSVGRERIDLVAYAMGTQRFDSWKDVELVCEMSAHREFGVKLTNGFVIIEQDELRSLNIGSLCFNEIVKWARRVAPADSVLPIELLASHELGYGKNNFERRHRFYRRFGLTFDFVDDQPPLAHGSSRDMRAQDLKEILASAMGNVMEIDVLRATQKLAIERHAFQEEDASKGALLGARVKEEIRLWALARSIARLLNWPIIASSFILGAVVAHPGHFGIHW
jgi:GNAT superfamily N-acetyltransferase